MYYVLYCREIFAARAESAREAGRGTGLKNYSSKRLTARAGCGNTVGLFQCVSDLCGNGVCRERGAFDVPATA
jgi:hypothetical protein